jgi:molybdenum cofactor guanylyltransferase
MGAPKAGLEWHGSTLLRRVAGLVARAAGPVVVVRAAVQELPPLPAAVRVVDDARPGRGPLQGLLAGLEALDPAVEAVVVAAADMPLLHPRLLTRALAALGPGDDAAVPRAGGRAHPLAAAYRTTVAPRVESLVAADLLAVHGLLERLHVAWLDAGEDDGLVGLNTPAEYAAARALPPPEVTVAGRGAVRAATLGAALGAAPEGAVRVDGEAVPWDPEYPLVAGDRVEVSRG